MGDRSILKINLDNKYKKICAFSENEQSLIVVTEDGRYYLYNVSNG